MQWNSVLQTVRYNLILRNNHAISHNDMTVKWPKTNNRPTAIHLQLATCSRITLRQRGMRRNSTWKKKFVESSMALGWTVGVNVFICSPAVNTRAHRRDRTRLIWIPSPRRGHQTISTSYTQGDSDGSPFIPHLCQMFSHHVVGQALLLKIFIHQKKNR